MMAEVLYFVHPEDCERSQSKTFTLRATEEEISITGHSLRTHPHFPVKLNVGERRILTGLNLLLSLDHSSPEEGMVNFTVSQFTESDDSLSMDSIQLKGDVLHIGSDAKLVLREFRQDGRPSFHMVAARYVRVKSIEHLQIEFSSQHSLNV